MARAPTASRPQMRGYGVPTHTKGLLDWAHADERLAVAAHYWVATANPDGTPHSVPVDGIWLDGCLYFGGGETTRWIRNLTANPRLAVHLESGDDVVILEGVAEHLTITDEALLRRLGEASKAKYGFALVGSPSWTFRPTTAFAWTNLNRDATRWRFATD